MKSLCSPVHRRSVVYACTEDAFPARRLEQLRAARRLTTAVTDLILIEHAPDVDSLQVCCERRVPQLAGRRPLCALIIDSVAAHFRCQYEAGEGGRRARDLQTLAGTLRRLSRQHSVAVLCVNQVTSVPRDGAAGGVTPALGLAWATQVTCRLQTTRTRFSLAHRERPSEAAPRLMQLRVHSASHLAADAAYYQIEAGGVRGVPVTDSTLLVPLPD
ncbi:DNA repair protein XRCC3-like [Pollicipes pollicipes]|uniref:DNA repair protein XRCC3-like n=1 Tax=Pollicipes pollicipes TaxID=41117 RepID=UPI00188561CB|nr:DNA repair protein XRCC3-like [Pollicipes pollicipes]